MHEVSSLCEVVICHTDVRPVAMHSTVFCIVSSFVMFVVDAMGDHMVKAYSSIGLVMALYFESNVFFGLPYLVEERTLRMGMVLILWPLCCQCVSEFRVEGRSNIFGMRMHV